METILTYYLMLNDWTRLCCAFHKEKLKIYQTDCDGVLREYDNTFTMDMNLYLQFDRLFLRSLCSEGSVLKGLGGVF